MLVVLVAALVMKFQEMKPRILEYHCAAYLPECPLFQRSWLDGVLVLQITAADSFRKDHADAGWSKAVEALQQKSARSRRQPRMLVLGPNTLFEDAAEFRQLAKMSTKLVLVEANERLNGNLTGNLLRYGHARENFDIMNAAMTDEPAGNLTFYVVDDGKQTESSLVNYFGSGVEVSVRSLTPGSLLEELGLDNVDILHTDLEGYDLRILSKFFALESFAPEILKFEWLFAAQQKGPGPFDMMPMLNMLSSRGYDLHQDAYDMIAVRRSLLEEA